MHEMVKTQKRYYLHNTRSAYFPVNRRLHRVRERERERPKEIERVPMSIHEMVKKQKQYYICNMRSAYIPIDSRLHRERETGCVHP